MVSTRNQRSQAEGRSQVTTPVKLQVKKEAAVETPVIVTSGFPLQTPPPSSSRKRSAPSTPASAFLTRKQISQIAPSAKFRDLCVPPVELRPSATLTTGQCFHWKVVNCSTATDDVVGTPGSTSSAWGTHDETEWVGVLRINAAPDAGSTSIVVAIQERPETTLYRILHGPPDLPYDDILKEYFQLGEPLAPLYEEWSQQDPRRLQRIAACIPGVRLIDQDPWECLVSFICSTNNNIPRITKMLTAIRKTFGKPLMTIPGGDDEDIVLYSFPSLEEMKAQATEANLRNECGMGYRAKYILTTMDTLTELGGEAYLHELRSINDPVLVQERLMVFSGVGPKVADCVALFSLLQAGAIPVDTHVWNLCRRDYDPDGIFAEVKSITPTVYRQVGDTFRNRFNPKAGWAHSLLFVAELPSFRAILPADIVQEMEQFREFEQNRKKDLKAAKIKRQKQS